MPRFRYTSEQLQFLEQGYKQLPVPELAAAFNKKFSLAKTEHQIKSCLSNNSFTCGRQPGLPKGSFRVMSPEEAQWLGSNYKRWSRVKLTEAFNDKFQRSMRVSQVVAFLKNHGFISGRDGRFKKGNKTWNTGTRGLTSANCGSFKPGNVPPNIKPLGHERICPKDGYVLVKVDEPNPYTGAPTRYKAKHLVVWEQHHGPVPAKHVVTFIDGDKLNCDIDNLECISQAENVRRNKLQLSSAADELKPTIKAMAKLITRTHERGRGNAE